MQLTNDTKNGVPNLFDYADARAYIRDKCASLKAANSKYSYRFISKQMGFRSPVFITRIISGERGIAVEYINSLIRIFKLSGEEARYFRYLCYYTEETDATKKEDYLDKLVSMNNTSKKELVKAEFQFHQAWYHNAIWAALDVFPFKGQKKEIEELGSSLFPRVPTEKVKESFRLLKKLNFIARDENGHWRPKDKSLFTRARIHNEIVANYWLKSLQLASQAILGKPKQAPRVYTNTFTCSERAFKKIDERLTRICSEIRAIVTKDEESARVVQFQFQLFDIFQSKGET